VLFFFFLSLSTVTTPAGAFFLEKDAFVFLLPGNEQGFQPAKTSPSVALPFFSPDAGVEKRSLPRSKILFLTTDTRTGQRAFFPGIAPSFLPCGRRSFHPLQQSFHGGAVNPRRSSLPSSRETAPFFPLALRRPKRSLPLHESFSSDLCPARCAFPAGREFPTKDPEGAALTGTAPLSAFSPPLCERALFLKCVTECTRRPVPVAVFSSY